MLSGCPHNFSIRNAMLLLLSGLSLLSVVVSMLLLMLVLPSAIIQEGQ